jgi:HKD family nuclease
LNHSGVIAQPRIRSTLDAIASVLESGSTEQIDVAVAYVTTGGVRDLTLRMDGILAASWPQVRKRWLVSFDYLRSEPVALRTLKSLPKSTVRVHDAERVIAQKCTPAVPFHPKAYTFRSADRHAVLAGSGNLSRSGLSRGYEAGLFLEVTDPVGVNDKAVQKSVQSLQKWFDSMWKDAVSLSDQLLARYQSLYESAAQLRRPTPTEDDTFSSTGRRSLSPDDLVKLRVCRRFWIEAGNVTKNLGPNKPGNQLMMRRHSRVFFGVPATNVPQNSPLTTIARSTSCTTRASGRRSSSCLSARSAAVLPMSRCRSGASTGTGR